MIISLSLDDTTLHALEEIKRVRGDRHLSDTVTMLVKQGRALQKVAEQGFNEIIARNSESEAECKVHWYKYKSLHRAVS